MKHPVFAIVLLLIMVSVVDSTGRPALGQQGPRETVQPAGTDALLARSASGIEVWKFDGTAWQQLPDGPPWSDASGWNAPEYYSTIQTGDIDGDGRDELLARNASYIEAWEFDGSEWQQLPNGPPLSDAANWNAPEYYSTIQTSDIDGDGNDELLARSASGIQAWEFDGSGWQQLPNGPPLSDAAGWNAPEYYSTIQMSDIDGDGNDELLARSASGIQAWELEGGGWQQLPNGPPWSDAGGWNAPEYYSTIQTADMYLVPWDQLLARSSSGIVIRNFNGLVWLDLPDGPQWSDANGWNAPHYYRTIQTADTFGFIDFPSLLARNASYIEVWQFIWPDWQQLPNGPPWSDAAGWNKPEYYSTIQTGDIDGDGWDELLGRNISFIEVWEFDGSDWQQLPNGPPWSDAAGWNKPEYYSTIQTADLEGLPPTYLPIILNP